MEKQEQQVATYKEKIQRFVGYLNDINPNWIVKRLWFKDLAEFKLGENFLSKVIFSKEEGDPEDKSDFYLGIYMYASINLQRKIGSKRVLWQEGFEIEGELSNEYEKTEHQEVLDYLWWITIYKMALKKNQFSKNEQIILEALKRKFGKRVKHVESLSY